ncbi:MAG: Stp1/IreP family PP2C-type Ser/Thr phosphatase [Oscillospiraceae bacterium]|nr:Stp1/IreP family PP2C-type Ser/Thr phosphatase [Oscillospiraceae bacterium]MBP1571618.1 Stp1/IreP family PP2C-type Ser/Thr phosphatase [Oscillospiraceae bacterium]MBQ5313661.1 Stp1/IreP family PP2C-type Ser/Thr phosphatase [Oscillospiraceae bacterium]MBQ5325446.1 Stp1/IreP family PP2C-type Ser/Thr phosphatase [Oscillospiraceae bacterium]
MKISGATNIGNRRSENQDKYIAGRLLNNVSFGFVCDGMGGVKGGKIASDLLAKYIEDSLYVHNESTSFNEEKTVLAAIEDACRAIYNLGEKNSEYKGMGTTVAGVTINGSKCTVYHAGDSRVYIVRDSKLALITSDHSVVQELLIQGKISEEEATNHPQKNLITRAVGVEETVQVDVAELEVYPGDILMCATDGLTNFVSPHEIVEILTQPNIFAMPDRLIQSALKNQATDNITAVVIAV